MATRLIAVLAISLSVFCWVGWSSMADEPVNSSLLKLGKQAEQKGNYRDALDLLKGGLERKVVPVEDVPASLTVVMQCLNRLGLQAEMDDLLETTHENYGHSAEVLMKLSVLMGQSVHQGQMINQQFERGYARTRNKMVSSVDRDRVLALRWSAQAVQSALNSEDKNLKGRALQQLADQLLQGRTGHQLYLLQTLTDLDNLPDYEELSGRRWHRSYSSGSAMPVDEQGRPIVFAIPESWETAANDGERWRWTLDQLQQMGANFRNESLYRQANFAWKALGVQTVRSELGSIAAREPSYLTAEMAPFVVRTLKDDETIAKLATGVKRFTLPAEWNFITLFRQLAESEDLHLKQRGIDQLASIYENRQQYPLAAELWQKSLEQFPKQPNSRKNRLNQILKPWGEAEPGEVTASGKPTGFQYRFRNAENVTFTIHQIKQKQLFADMRAYLKSKPEWLDDQLMRYEQIGYDIVVRNKKKYLGDQQAKWSTKLDSRPGHLDRRISVPTTIASSGLYLLTAKVEGGNTSYLVLNVPKVAIVEKGLEKANWYALTDALTGKPLANTRLNFFGSYLQYRERVKVRNENKTRVTAFTSEFVERTNEQGEVIVPDKLFGKFKFNGRDQNYRWMAYVEDSEGGLSLVGAASYWSGRIDRTRWQQNKTFSISDRPIYKPAETVNYKFWFRKVGYGNVSSNPFAKEEVEIVLRSPSGEELMKTTQKLDEFGGVHGTYELPATAMLGQYHIRARLLNIRSNQANLNFRVEEYKKPEYEVTVQAPAQSVQLGEAFHAKVQARYYYGAPVKKGTVSVKVTRTAVSKQWYPVDRWDWLYGRGYWWFGTDYDWYPGFGRWGCYCPVPPWWNQPSDPPEVVLETEAQLTADGTVELEIDTALALALHGDQDHRYSITAEVVDESRRLVSGSGEVTVAREPFDVMVWLNRGYAEVGKPLTATMKAHTLSQTPIQGSGVLHLMKIRYNQQGEPVEHSVAEWNVDLGEQGQEDQTFVVSEPGQYRLKYLFTSNEGKTLEGGHIFQVRGEAKEQANYRFNDLELTLEKRTYQPGEKVRLLVNTNQSDSTVWLFVRPRNGIYTPPKQLTLNGQSQLVELDVSADDAPNFFVEAITVHNAQLYTVLKEIMVPPQKRVLNVEVKTSKSSYLPGEKVSGTIQITDENGEPVQGVSVATAYDRAIEAIAGGSNVSEIVSHFWKFKYDHHPSSSSSLNRGHQPLVQNGKARMQSIGIFGSMVADEDLIVLNSSRSRLKKSRMLGRQSEMRGEGFGIGGGGFGGGPVPTMAPMSAPRSSLQMADAAVDFSGAAPQAPVEPSLRSDFADALFWNPDLKSDANGQIPFHFTMSDSLSDWVVKAWSLGEGSSVGEGETSIQSVKNVFARLQAPRFFVEKDEVIVSANLHNDLDIDLLAKVEFLLEGKTLEVIEGGLDSLTLNAGGEQRVDWKLKAIAPGEAKITVRLLSDVESDAVQMTFPVYVHGAPKLESWTGTVRPQQPSSKFVVRVPEQRKHDQTQFEIRYTPSLAGAMLDALPYLLEYPYGCTEQTLNRFLPLIVTRKAMGDLGVDLKQIQESLKREQDNPQAPWSRSANDPVFDEDEANLMAKVGIKRLGEMQLSDGGWGWFTGRGEYSSPHTTAVVVRGLWLAQQSGYELPEEMLERGINWLVNYQNKQIKLLKKGEQKKPKSPYRSHANSMDAFVLSILTQAAGDVESNAPMASYVYRDRLNLPTCSQIHLGLSLHAMQDKRLDLVLQNLDQFLKTDLENDTAYLETPAQYGWWHWYSDDIETNAQYLQLLVRTRPENPTASRIVKYLLNNRKNATYWKSTRDTSHCIEAFAEYLVATEELQAEMQVQVLIDGQLQQEMTITPETYFTGNYQLVLGPDEITTGEHTVEIVRSGEGPLYWSGYLSLFTLEDPIQAAGLELKVQRVLYRLVPEEATTTVAGSSGQAIDQAVEKYKRVRLDSNAQVTSGDLIEVELMIESKNDYEYVIAEDFKPAGCEAMDALSGYIASANGAYVEFREEKVAMFFRKIRRGTTNLTYRLRAEVPGRFSALPVQTYAMYSPDLKANSNEFKLNIADLPPARE